MKKSDGLFDNQIWGRIMAPKLGDERYLLEILSIVNVEALAKSRGYKGGDLESIRDFCEPEEAATYSVHKTLDEAKEAAKQHLTTGNSFYGCALIDREIYEKPTDDKGRLISVPPEWERQETYEVAMDGEVISVQRN